MVKEKLDRTYEDGFRLRAACICVRDSTETEVLLVTSSQTKDCWIVPGGGIEDNESPEVAAIRETQEEAGVCGVIRRCIGDFEVFDERKERKHRTSVFVMQVDRELDVYDDVKVRHRSWFPVEKALHLLSITKPVQCTYMNMFIRTSAILWARAGHLLNISHPSAVMNVTIKSSLDEGQPLPSAFHQVDYYSALKKDRCNGSENLLCYSFICTRSMFADNDNVNHDNHSFNVSLNQAIPDLPQHSKADNTAMPIKDNGNLTDSAQGSNQ